MILGAEYSLLNGVDFQRTLNVVSNRGGIKGSDSQDQWSLESILAQVQWSMCFGRVVDVTQISLISQGGHGNEFL